MKCKLSIFQLDPRTQLAVQLCTGSVAFADLELDAWSDVVPILRRCGLLGRIATRSENQMAGLAPKVRDQLAAAAVVAQKQQLSLVNEIVHIGKLVNELPAPVLLLKGAAYEALGLPNSTGRFSSDVDLMVPARSLRCAEELMVRNGWNHIKLSSYDQKYYRTWMHELPPLRHGLRGTYLDLHHTIVPPTSRYHLDPGPLFQDAIETRYQGLYTLSATDLVLHSAVHLFSDSEFNHALRDLFDIHDLLAHFSSEPDFMERLVQRSFSLNLERPLYYALTGINRWFGAELPDSVLPLLQPARPVWPIAGLMQRLLRSSIFPVEYPTTLRRVSSWILLCRAHYLRMPLRLLIPHLARKAMKAIRKDADRDSESG